MRRKAALGAPALLLQQGFKFGVGQTCEIGPDAYGVLLFAVEDHAPCLLRAVRRHQLFHQPAGHAAHHAEVGHGIGLPVGPCDFVLAARKIAQHRIDKAAGRLHAHGAGELHRLVHRGAVGHAVQKQNLIRTHAQNVSLNGFAGGMVHQAIQRIIDLQLVFQRAIDQARSQAAVLRRQMRRTQPLAQSQRGVGALLAHVGEHVQRQAAGIQTALDRAGPGAAGR